MEKEARAKTNCRKWFSDGTAIRKFISYATATGTQIFGSLLIAFIVFILEVISEGLSMRSVLVAGSHLVYKKESIAWPTRSDCWRNNAIYTSKEASLGQMHMMIWRVTESEVDVSGDYLCWLYRTDEKDLYLKLTVLSISDVNSVLGKLCSILDSVALQCLLQNQFGCTYHMPKRVPCILYV